MRLCTEFCRQNLFRLIGICSPEFGGVFQIGIAVGAISVLTKRKRFWLGSLGFGVAGVVLLILGIAIA